MIDYEYVDLDLIERYLKSHGWNQSEIRREGYGYWYDDEGHEVLLPKTDEYKDFKLRISELVNQLAYVEREDPCMIKDKLQLRGIQ
jgi:hypothetical protein